MTYVSLDQARQQAGVKLTTTSSSSSGYVSLDQARQQAIQGNAGKKPVAPVKTQPIPPVIKITPNQTNIFQNAQKELQKVVKVGTDTVLSFVKPKQQVKSLVPKDQVINKNVAQQQPQATPILKIAPDQKKLTPMQLEQVQPASAQMRVTPQSIEAQKQTVAKGTKFITDVKNTQTFKTMEDLKIDPLQFKANPKKAVDGFLTTVKDALTEEKKRINDFIKVYQNLKSSDSEKLGAKINLVSGTANVVFSPLTGLFKAAEEIPVLATLSKVISLPFTAAGELSTEVSNKVVDALPISTKAKNDIKAPLGEMVALASQLIIGKVAEITPGKRTELVNKYGIEDANTIIKKARELAKDKMGRTRMNTVLPDGEYTPQQVMGKVIANGLENTPEGRTLVKTAVEAQQRGESVQVKNTPETIQTFEQNIQDYRSFGGYTVGTSVENAALRDIAGLSTKPEVIKHTQEKVKTAIESGEVKTNTDGTITLYRGGNPSTKNGLSSATYDKTIAQRFADNAGGVLHEFKVKPEDIQAFIGKAEKEVLVKNEKVQPKGVEVPKQPQNLKTDSNNQRVLNTKEVNAVRKTIGDKIEKIGEKAQSEKDLENGFVDLYDSVVREANNDKVVLSALRTELNKQMYDLAGTSGTYKEAYATLQTMIKSDSPMAPVLSKLEDLVISLDKKLVSAQEPARVVPLAPEKVKVVERNKPLETVGTGETVKSKFAGRIEQTAVEQGLADTFGQLPEYQKTSMKEQASLAIDLIKSDFQKAVQVALGNEIPPKGLLPEIVLKVVKDYAVKNQDVSLIRQLATESNLSRQLTAMGQRIRAAGEFDKSNPVDILQDIVDNRRQRIEEMMKTSVKEATEKTVKEIKTRVKAPDKYDWSTFLDSIQC